ncbi:MAG: hypothetical protein QXN04_10140 [Pyrobaculum sp.]
MYLGRIGGAQFWTLLYVDADNRVKSLYLYKKGADTKWRARYLGRFDVRQLADYVRRLGAPLELVRLLTEIFRQVAVTKRGVYYVKSREAAEASQASQSKKEEKPLPQPRTKKEAKEMYFKIATQCLRKNADEVRKIVAQYDRLIALRKLSLMVEDCDENALILADYMSEKEKYQLLADAAQDAMYYF